MKRAIAARRGRPPADASGVGAKERILTAARRLFAKQGFDGTAVRDIAEAAGVADSALYHHFANKREVYRALLQEAGPNTVLVAMRAHQHLVADPPRFLNDVLGALVENWVTPAQRSAISIFMRDVLDGRGSRSGLFAATAEAREGLGAVFDDWQKRRLIARTVAPEQLAWQIMSPLVMIRVMYFNAGSSRSEIALGCDAARAHIEFVLKTLVG